MTLLKQERKILVSTRGLTEADLSSDEKEFLRLFHAADAEAQELITREVILMAIFGDPFFQEVKGLGLVSETDRQAMREIMERWEAKLQEEEEAQ